MTSVAPPREHHSRATLTVLAVLDTFTAETPILGVTDIAHKVGVAQPTAYRYLQTLKHQRYVEQDPTTRQYRLGGRIAELWVTWSNSGGLRERARPFLARLRDESQQTIGLAVLNAPEVTYVDYFYPARPGSGHVAPGTMHPAQLTAAGKVLLAFQSAADLERLLPEIEMTRRGPNSITRKKALKEELQEVREKGWAASDQELATGIYEIAAPIRSVGGEVVAAISAFTRSHDTKNATAIRSYLAHLRSTADEIAEGLGYSRWGSR